MATLAGRLVGAALYLAGAWVALAVILISMTWAPADALAESARFILLLAGSVGLLIGLVGGTAGLLGLFGRLSPRDPEPRP